MNHKEEITNTHTQTLEKSQKEKTFNGQIQDKKVKRIW